MPRHPESGRRTGRPPATSREQVVATARDILERHGADRLTIRRLAAELGVGPTTLYRHVQDREDLLVLLINDFVAQLPAPHFPAEPRARIVAAAVTVHDWLASWPWAAEVLTSDGFIGRVGPRALEPVEAIVSGAVESGCTPDGAVEVFRQLWYFTVGEILVRARTRRGEAIGTDFAFDPAAVPHLAAIGERWATVAQQDAFESGVEAFVDGLLARVAAGDLGRDQG